jgi:hypothetical protein
MWIGPRAFRNEALQGYEQRFSARGVVRLALLPAFPFYFP